ncbi:hypothetical protein EVAR_36107_1 [Eumeta japonica]|uniref:Uncharacterized protein n=1 Tax=Eumeta variegata TaxID=151549 RepID=A0A4C1X5H5_EUMVA|nr:hypothetical protein EVAR_36107_1 [Eumeta japonica]
MDVIAARESGNVCKRVKKTVKDYAVVQFIESELYSEIPSNWLLYDSFAVKDKTSCRWPGRKEKNFTQKIKNRVDPSKDWPIRAVNVIRFCETLESARKAADDSQYSSTAEMVGRGYRSRKISSPVRRALNLKKKPNIISRSDDDSFKVIKFLHCQVFLAIQQDTTHIKNKCQGSDSVESREGLSEADSSDDSVNETLARARALLNDNNFNKDTSGNSCRKNCFDKYPSFDKNEFSKAGTNWFRLGNQRTGSQPKQMLKKWHLQTNADATERNSPPAGN